MLKIQWVPKPFFPYGNSGWSGGAKVLDNFHCQGVLLISVLADAAGGNRFDFFLSIVNSRFHYLPLRETAQYRLKYCLKGSLNPKLLATNQPYFN